MNNRFDEVLGRMNEDRTANVGKPFPVMSTSTPWSTLDDDTRQNVTRLAQSISSSNRPIALLGEAGSGKSFLLDAFAFNTTHWKSRIRNVPALIDFTVPKGYAINPERIEMLIKNAEAQLQRSRKDIRVVTSDYRTALNFHSSGAQSILMTECFNFDMQASQDQSFGSWEVLRVCEMNYTIDNIAEALSGAPMLNLKRTFYRNFTRDDIYEMIETLSELEEQLTLTNDGQRDVMPGAIGHWARAFERVASYIAFSDHEITMAQAVADTLDDLREDFLLDPVGAMEEGQPLKQFVALLNGENQAPSEQKEVTRPKFRKFADVTHDMKSRIIGQETAVGQVIDGLVAPAAGLTPLTKPIQSYLFLGPTGVGKTETALSLAKYALEEELNVVRLDMSEYSEKHNSSRLFGSPPGYVGYDEGGKLTNAIKENPNSLILLDEIEKAHPSVWDQFLQVLDAGRMTDGQGETVDFTGCIIVMTSNLGASEYSKRPTGFGSDESRSRADAIAIASREVDKFLRPEFVNRIGSQVVFDALDNEALVEILRREVSVIADRLSDNGHQLKRPRVDILRELASRVDIAKFGARDAQRIIERFVSKPIALAVLEGEAGEEARLKLSMKNHEIEVARD